MRLVGLAKRMTLYQTLKTACEKHPRPDSLVFEGAKISSKFLLQNIHSVAYFLSNLDSTTQSITINLPNIPQAVISFYASSYIGMPANMVHPLLLPEQLLKHMQDCKSTILFTFCDYYIKNQTALDASGHTIIICKISDHLPPLKKLIYQKTKEHKHMFHVKHFFYNQIVSQQNPQIAPAQKCEKSDSVYLHSGGTSGKSKTVALSAFAINALSKSLCVLAKNPNPKNISCLAVLPMFHGFGLAVSIHACLAHGFRVVLMPKFNAKSALKKIDKYKINILAGIPKMYERLLLEENLVPLKHLQLIFSGGDKLSDKLRHQFNLALKSVGNTTELLEGYGLTECVTVCCVNRAGDNSKNSMGYPLAGIKMGVVNENRSFLPPNTHGEIAVFGNTLMNGYLGENATNPFFTTATGEKWLLTGDYGKQSENGKIYFLGRKKRLIKISGYNVFPQEIEDIATNFDNIIQAVALCSGGEIHLFIRTQTQDSTICEQLKTACEQKLLPHAVPQKITIVPDFPLTKVGKIDYQALVSKISS